MSFETARENALKKASEQSFALEVVKQHEAHRIASLCDLRSKQHHSAAFVDVALLLLTYPPELGFCIAIEFSNYAHEVGFQPFGTIIVALGSIDSLYGGVIARKSLLDHTPDLASLTDSPSERISRAGALLAAGILISSESVSDARSMFSQMVADDPIKEAIVENLQLHDSRTAAIVSGHPSLVHTGTFAKWVLVGLIVAGAWYLFA